MATVDAGTITLTATAGLTVNASGPEGQITMAGLTDLTVKIVSDSPVLMMLEGGPLDGEIQVVEMLPTNVGDELFFNVPHFQTFDPNQPDAEVLVGQGLQAIYALSGQGPAPGAGDRWNTSWVFDFTGEVYIPTPPFLPTPPAVDVQLAQVWMTATTTLVPDTIPVSTDPIVTMTAESVIEVDAEVTPVAAGTVAMTGETVMTVQADWDAEVYMGDTTTSMEIDPD